MMILHVFVNFRGTEVSGCCEDSSASSHSASVWVEGPG